MMTPLFSFKKHQPIVEKEFEKDENGNIILDVTIRDDCDFLSPFSASRTPVISHDVAEFLEAHIDAIKPREGIALHIHSDCITKEEEKRYREAIHTYYTEQYHANRRILRRNTLLATLLLCLGVATLAVMILVDSLVGNLIWTEVIDIAAWVFLWEAVDLHFLEGHALRVRRMRILALLSMKVNFYPLG